MSEVREEQMISVALGAEHTDLCLRCSVNIPVSLMFAVVIRL